PPPPPPPPPLAVSLSTTTWTGEFFTGGPPIFDLPVTATAINGTTPYAYLWERTGGDTAAAAANSTARTTTFNRAQPASGTEQMSTWRCRVTDAQSAVAYSPNLVVTFYRY
ncbi:hypothetical protein, partial [Brevundimonas sp. P7753]|uniref:hypothetical protein n=1 Tax=Brevundimonas sp. P7753 TaxID=2726982 RepID=UPI001C4DD228